MAARWWFKSESSDKAAAQSTSLLFDWPPACVGNSDLDYSRFTLPHLATCALPGHVPLSLSPIVSISAQLMSGLEMSNKWISELLPLVQLIILNISEPGPGGLSSQYLRHSALSSWPGEMHSSPRNYTTLSTASSDPVNKQWNAILRKKFNKLSPPTHMWGLVS